MVINSKSTKAEILAAYKESEKQKKTLQSEIKQKKRSHNTAIASTPTKSISVTDVPSNMRTVSSKNISNTIFALEEIKSNFGSAVGNLSEQLITEATQLESIRQAIATEKYQLETLHKLVDVEKSTIDLLLEQYQITAKDYTQQYIQQKELDEAEIITLQLAWTKEQENQRRVFAAEKEAYLQSQMREKSEYEYNLDKERDLAEAEYEQEKKAKVLELLEARQTLENQWQEKETTISKQEQEQTIIKDKVVAFESQLQTKIKQGREEGKGIGNYQAKIKTDLRSKEVSGSKQNYELRIESLEKTIKHQTSRINKLSQQLDSSLQQVQDLAVKAIEGTANRNSYEAMKAIALEQVKTQQKGK